LLKLAKAHKVDEVEDVMLTNAFGVYYANEEDLHNNLFINISRFNHDCRPNAHYFFDPDYMAHFVHALRHISPGEEISITYTDAEQLYNDRYSATMASWGFGCTCSLCRLPSDHVEASDKRLKMIHKLKKQLSDWSKPIPDRSKMAELMVELYKQERLDMSLAYAYEHAAYAYAVEGDHYNTVKYASLATDALTIILGKAHSTIEMEQLMLNPTKHRTWLWSYQKPGEENLKPNATIRPHPMEEEEYRY